ncbi:MAG: dihydropyrimidinase [Bacteroidetes bacterium]|nr:dihydropyrimidinase [Bacteroidota bacterium]MBU1720720.1 dihydropyrimidinase [Bacteroidota bacterium]
MTTNPGNGTIKDPILIRNGKIISDIYTGTGDLLISGGKVVACGIAITLPPGRKAIEIDAAGHLVFPGGVDAHVHFNLPTPVGNSVDGFENGSTAGIAGGTTTFIDFVTPAKGQSLIKAFAERKEEAKNSRADFGLHMSLTSWKNEYNKEVQECIEMGISSFKVYLAYKKTVGVEDKDLVRISDSVRRYGGLLMAHCENGDLISFLQQKFFASKKREARYHAASRPPFVEAEAVFKMISYSEAMGIPLYIAHVSTQDSIKLIRRAKERGVKVICETCPQYLVLDQSVYNEPQETAIGYICSPPLREKYHNEQLWKAISTGVADVVSTDHCPFSLKNQKIAGLQDFRKVPNGLMGIEERLSILYTAGVRTGKIPLKKFVDLVSIQPAKIFGMYPQKGSFVTGADADVVIWDTNASFTVNSTSKYAKADYNVYAGMELTGRPLMVIQRGQITFEKGKFVSQVQGGFIFRNETALI